jgi:CheY-like chemotaxis protein
MLPHHFLLVENDATEANMLAQAFADIPECGTVFVARNISEAKAYLLGAGVYQDRARFRLPSTILSSYRLDGDSGIDLLAWIKAQTTLQTIPFVLLTPATASSTELAQAKRTGSVKIVSKPENPRELKSMLEHLAAAMCYESPELSF